MSIRHLPSPHVHINVDVENHIGTIAINNPEKRNAISFEMWRAIPDIIQNLGMDEEVRVIVVRGKDDLPFASGADISEFETLRADAAGALLYEDANSAAFTALARCLKPTVAMIHRYCIGGGMGLALACDMRIASQGTQFAIPAARLGLGYPPVAMRLALSAVGPALMKDMIFTARRIEADEAKAIGLIHQVFAKDKLETETVSLVQTIAANAPLTIQAAKATINAFTGITEGHNSAALRRLTDHCFDSEDYKEGRQAFLEKRAPVFKGE